MWYVIFRYPWWDTPTWGQLSWEEFKRSPEIAGQVKNLQEWSALNLDMCFKVCWNGVGGGATEHSVKMYSGSWMDLAWRIHKRHIWISNQRRLQVSRAKTNRAENQKQHLHRANEAQTSAARMRVGTIACSGFCQVFSSENLGVLYKLILWHKGEYDQANDDSNSLAST